jgi:Tfp pilus assembly protein PilO
MFNAEIRNLLIQVITSWQVIAVTIVIILYFFLVSYVAKVYHRRPRKAKTSLSKKKEAKSEEPVLDESDELGLEEQGPDRD